MILVKVKHYYDGIGNNSDDVWSVVNSRNGYDVDEDWSEDQCREFVEEQNNDTYVLDHNEYSRPTYYIVDKCLPDWSDGGWYDYDKCESAGKEGCTCTEGCEECPYIQSCFNLQKAQQIEWIEKNGIEL